MTMRTERLDTATVQGKRVAVWRSAPDSPAPDCPIVVLNAGFARRMRDVGSIALSMVRNGAVVYRFDSVDHLGLSEGDIVHFTMSAMVESLSAAIDLARATEHRRTVRVVALSLANLAAYRLAADDPDIERIVAISGVVNGIRTLAHAIGHDYSETEFDELPERVTVLDREIDPRPLWIDYQETKCLDPETAMAYLSRIAAGVANCVASDDPWVDIEDCDRTFTVGGGGDRLIVKLPYSGHDLGRNPVAISTILTTLTRFVFSSGPLRDAHSYQVALPGFDELLDLRIAERNQEKVEAAVASGRGASR